MSLPEQTGAFSPTVLTSTTRDYNPDTGSSLVLTYEGTDAQISAIRANWELAGQGAPIGYGYKTTTSKTANGTRLTVKIPDGILFTDRWNIETEVAHLNLWQSESLREFLADGTGNKWSTYDLSVQASMVAWMNYVRRINAAVNAVLASGPSSDSLTQALATLFPEHAFDGTPAFPDDAKACLAVIYALVRGGGYIEQKRPILKRVRYIPTGSEDRMSLTGPTRVSATTR